MPARIHKYLDEIDLLRDRIDRTVDERLAVINIKPIASNPKQITELFKLLFVEYLKKENDIITISYNEGIKLAKSL